MKSKKAILFITTILLLSLTAVGAGEVKVQKVPNPATSLVKKWEKAFEQLTTKNLPKLVISELSRESAVVRDHLNGNFDGIHRGHQALVARCKDLAEEHDAVAVVTFEPLPQAFFQPHHAPARLSTGLSLVKMISPAVALPVVIARSVSRTTAPLKRASSPVEAMAKVEAPPLKTMPAPPTASVPVPVAGGDIETVCDCHPHYGISWTEDGNIVFAQYGAGLGIVPATGGVPDTLAVPDPGLPESVKTLSLSYTFYQAEDVAEGKEAKKGSGSLDSIL